MVGTIENNIKLPNYVTKCMVTAMTREGERSVGVGASQERRLPGRRAGACL